MTTEFKSWDELSQLEQAREMYWDMYKDAYGVRPRWIDTTKWTVEDFEAEFASLATAIEQAETQRKAEQAESIAKFEQHVMNTICMGARNRETALKWIMDASNANGDWEYLCYDLGLPYSYFKQVA